MNAIFAVTAYAGTASLMMGMLFIMPIITKKLGG